MPLVECFVVSRIWSLWTSTSTVLHALSHRPSQRVYNHHPWWHLPWLRVQLKFLDIYFSRKKYFSMGIRKKQTPKQSYKFCYLERLSSIYGILAMNSGTELHHDLSPIGCTDSAFLSMELLFWTCSYTQRRGHAQAVLIHSHLAPDEALWHKGNNILVMNWRCS